MEIFVKSLSNYQYFFLAFAAYAIVVSIIEALFLLVPKKYNVSQPPLLIARESIIYGILFAAILTWTH